MDAPMLRLLDRYLAWLVALLASLEAFGAAAQGVADRRTDHVVIWLLMAAAIIVGSSRLETEPRRGESRPHPAARNQRRRRTRAPFWRNPQGLMVVTPSVFYTSRGHRWQ